MHATDRARTGDQIISINGRSMIDDTAETVSLSIYLLHRITRVYLQMVDRQLK